MGLRTRAGYWTRHTFWFVAVSVDEADERGVCVPDGACGGEAGIAGGVCYG